MPPNFLGSSPETGQCTDREVEDRSVLDVKFITTCSTCYTTLLQVKAAMDKVAAQGKAKQT